METIHGKRTHMLDATRFAAELMSYRGVLIDLGTGDGRYVRSAARASPERFVIGLDACRENLRAASRSAPTNALFVIANALDLPHELRGLANQITINFPWGSLLVALVNGDPVLFDGLRMLALPGAHVEIRLNAGALVEAGLSLEQGGIAVRQALRTYGFNAGPLVSLDAADLRACPTTWAKRLAFGRDPRALYLRASVLEVERRRPSSNTARIHE
jgi:16S rRNA (adenine(1408)-N(1))-methyltransferase